MPRRSSSQGGRGRGYYYLLIFCKAGGEGNIIVWVRGGLTGRGEGGKIIMIDFLKGGRALSYLPRRSSSQRGGVGGGALFLFFFARPSFWARMKPLKGSRWVRESSQGQVGGRGGGADYYDLFVFLWGGRVIVIISAS